MSHNFFKELKQTYKPGSVMVIINLSDLLKEFRICIRIDGTTYLLYLILHRVGFTHIGIATLRSELLPHYFTLTSHINARSGIVSVTLSSPNNSRHWNVRVTDYSALWCPDFPLFCNTQKSNHPAYLSPGVIVSMNSNNSSISS